MFILFEVYILKGRKALINQPIPNFQSLIPIMALPSLRWVAALQVSLTLIPPLRYGSGLRPPFQAASAGHSSLYPPLTGPCLRRDNRNSVMYSGSRLKGFGYGAIFIER